MKRSTSIAEARITIQGKKLDAAAWIYCSRPDITQARRASEGRNLLPRLRFGLVYDVSNLTGSGIDGETRPARR